MITHRDALPGVREWISPRGYAQLGDDALPCQGLCSGGLMQGGSKRKTDRKVAAMNRHPAGSEGGLRVA
jgi:hypothetical protein